MLVYQRVAGTSALWQLLQLMSQTQGADNVWRSVPEMRLTVAKGLKTLSTGSLEQKGKGHNLSMQENRMCKYINICKYIYIPKDPITLSTDDLGCIITSSERYLGSITILRRWLDPYRVYIYIFIFCMVYSLHVFLFKLGGMLKL